MKMKEEGRSKKFVSIIVILGMVIAGVMSMNVIGAGQLPYYDIEQDSLGNYHKAFIDNSTGNYELYYTNDIGGQFPQDWNPPNRITNTTNESLLLDLGIYLPTDTMFIIWKETMLISSPPQGLTYYTISRDYGANWREPNRSYENITLKYADFDPLIEEPEVPSLPDNYAEPYTYYIVQMKTPMIQEWWDGIEDEGGIFCGYIPNNAYIIWATPQIKDQVAQLPFVRWINYYHPAYKIQCGLLNNTGIIEVNVVVVEETGGQANLGTVIAEIEALGGNITYNGSDNYIIRTQIDASRIYDIASIKEVKWIDKYEAKRYFMNYIRQFTGASTLFSNGFRGTGIIGEVCDIGVDHDHPDLDNIVFNDNIPQDDNDEFLEFWYQTNGHGTATTGVIFSNGNLDGDGDSDAMGILPSATAAFACSDIVTRTGSIDQLADWGGVFQSNSWGEGTLDSQYTSNSKEDDQCVLDYDITMVYAAGNSDDGVYKESCSHDSVAKNVIGVGAVYHGDNTERYDDNWNDNGGPGHTPSQGPAADGRFKPDLCGPFDYGYVTDSVDGDWEDGYRPGNYVYKSPDDMLFGGTSLATPVIAGGAGLVYEMYRENHFDNNPTGEYPHASTVKALLIANAYQYDCSGPWWSQAWRHQQGWGMIDVDRVYEIGDNHFIVNEDLPLSEGEWFDYNLYVDSNRPLKISLVWTDPPGEESADKAIVNNLGLMVKDPDDNYYWGNLDLWGDMWSKPYNSNLRIDTVNNVQNVFIENPTNGQWTITVMGWNINEDAYEDTPELDQPFALVATYQHVIPVKLYAGWNLISLPLVQEDPYIFEVLSSIHPYWDAVQYFDASDAEDPWKDYCRWKGGELQYLYHHMGFWILISDISEVNLLVKGREFREIYGDQGYVPVPLYGDAGPWNMVGYPSNINRNGIDALNNLNWLQDIDLIQYFDAQTETWHNMNPYNEEFELGRGYWFHMVQIPSPPIWQVPLDPV
ncbi:MAG: S8 family serine peptidase [Methanomassiliicoccales archaeon]|nr:MAG: S8 family serine peptidase [Methanomassiliicoccales archaeon]